MVLEAGRLRSSCQKGWIFLSLWSLAYRQPSSHVLTWLSLCVSVLISYFRDTSNTGLGHTPKAPFYSGTSLKIPSPHTATFWSTGGWGFDMNFGRHSSAPWNVHTEESFFKAWVRLFFFLYSESSGDFPARRIKFKVLSISLGFTWIILETSLNPPLQAPFLQLMCSIMGPLHLLFPWLGTLFFKYLHALLVVFFTSWVKCYFSRVFPW